MERGEKVGIQSCMSEYADLELVWVVAMHVRIHRLGELVWVVSDVLVLDWKGWRGWGYSACQIMQVRGTGVWGGHACQSGELVLVVAKWVLCQWAMCCELADHRLWRRGLSSRWRMQTMTTWADVHAHSAMSPALLRWSPEQGKGDGKWQGATATFSHLIG